MTNGRANWKDISASSRVSRWSTPMACMAHVGMPCTAGAATPAASAYVATSRRWLTAGAVGASRKVFHSASSSAALIIASAKSGT